MQVYYKPPSVNDKYLYESDFLDRGDSIQIECVLGSTWLICNAITGKELVNYTIQRQQEDTNLVILSNLSTVPDQVSQTDQQIGKIEFQNELGFPVSIFIVKKDTESAEPLEEILVAEM